MIMPITAIISAFNEEISIGSVVLRAKKYTDRVLVVDDGSIDRTCEVARLAGAEVIQHHRNIGKGAALKTGFGRVNDATVIVVLDCRYDPEEIPVLVAPILAGKADMVNGSRYINGGKKDIHFYHRIGWYLLDTVTNLNSGLHITDTQSGFRAFSRNTFPVFGFNTRGFGIESEMLMDAAKAGLRIKEVEIGVNRDMDSSTGHTASHGLRIFMNVLEDIELNRPLYYFTIPGMVISIIGLAMGLNFLHNFYLGGRMMYGPTLLMMILTLMGIFMSFTGIILHSMSRLLNENSCENKVNNRTLLTYNKRAGEI
ncbi:MAG: dolichyl-phosphate mannose synthase [Candidatus Methanoperedenaceae archaeon]|nr:MAG: dolichyl-phosphate mannose synthase [Candidatus Methanoperedenaceae archaeon]